MSADGKIALSDGTRARLSSPEDRARVERLRAECDAILVGINTVLKDDPSLLVGEGVLGARPQPWRVVLDTRLRTPPGARVLRGGRVLVFTASHAKPPPGAETIVVGGRIDPAGVVAELAKLGVDTLLVEGGGEVIWSFLDAGVVSELHTYVAPIVIGGRGTPTPAGGTGASSLEAADKMELVSSTRLGAGILLSYRLRR